MDVRKPAVPRPIAGQTGNANAQPAGDAAAITLQVCYRFYGAPRLYLHVLVSIGL